MVNEDRVLRRTILKSKEVTRRYRNVTSQNYLTFSIYVLKYKHHVPRAPQVPNFRLTFSKTTVTTCSGISLKIDIHSAPKRSVLYFNTYGGKGPKFVRVQMSYTTARTL
jgi:hypothetical protein